MYRLIRVHKSLADHSRVTVLMSNFFFLTSSTRKQYTYGHYNSCQWHEEHYTIYCTDNLSPVDTPRRAIRSRNAARFVPPRCVVVQVYADASRVRDGGHLSQVRRTGHLRHAKPDIFCSPIMTLFAQTKVDIISTRVYQTLVLPSTFNGLYFILHGAIDCALSATFLAWACLLELKSGSRRDGT